MYKEFPINGLISYFSDEEELFISKEEILLQGETTNLIDENIASERLFKLKVLEFFNDGEPKLFRSPVEGNYIIKLMNVNMTPTD
jgi:predicted ribonuclease toxin of YeeF-YezG toxin-antitoxin module